MLKSSFSSVRRHYSSNISHKVVVAGAGTAGLSIASKLSRVLPSGLTAIIEPRDHHHNQALWTLVGGGVKKLQQSRSETRKLIPRGAKWIQDSIASFDPVNNTLSLKSGQKVTYEYLVLALGLHLDFKRIDGLIDALKQPGNGVCSNYSHETVEKTWQCIQSLDTGNALFTLPNTPIKCAGAPQKIMYLTDDYTRRHNIRHKINIDYFTALGTIFSAPKYAAKLNEIVEKRHLNVHYKHNLIAVDGDKKVATFENLDTKEKVTRSFDMLHVTPPQVAPPVLSPFADATGFVNVDKCTLQHVTYSNVFALGDNSNLPTSKTAAAVAGQSIVAFRNLTTFMKQGQLTDDTSAKYDGYTSCPLVTGYDSLILAEFDYNLQPKETFFFDQGRERKSMFYLKQHIIPFIYWNMLIKGLWNGPGTYRKFLNPTASG